MIYDCLGGSSVFSCSLIRFLLAQLYAFVVQHLFELNLNMIIECFMSCTYQSLSSIVPFLFFSLEFDHRITIDEMNLNGTFRVRKKYIFGIATLKSWFYSNEKKMYTVNEDNNKKVSETEKKIYQSRFRSPAVSKSME